jgi:two-component system, NtrC family, response regulator AtoC
MILLIEDDAIARTALAEHLRASGHEVLEAANAEEAVASMSVQRVTLVIADFVLPDDVDGLEFLESIRQLVPDLPLILISGYPHHQAGEALTRKFGAGTLYLHKPVRPTALELTVQSLLSSN